jgi:putative ABC transport system ATP-binding protein
MMIRTEHLHRIYHTKGEDVHAVNDVNLTVERGQMTAIIGRSGAGKTTLLNVISGLDQPTRGSVWIDDIDIFALSETQRVALRRDRIGFVFQNFGLLPLLSAAENVSLPLRMQKLALRQIDMRVREALDWVGLTKRAHHRPYELSGGEQQRVAIARALAARPDIILADEPTGQLDSHTGRSVLAIMRQIVDEYGTTMVIVTHDPQIMHEADTVFRLDEGRLTTSEETSEPIG